MRLWPRIPSASLEPGRQARGAGHEAGAGARAPRRDANLDSRRVATRTNAYKTRSHGHTWAGADTTTASTRGASKLQIPKRTHIPYRVASSDRRKPHYELRMLIKKSNTDRAPRFRVTSRIVRLPTSIWSVSTCHPRGSVSTCHRGPVPTLVVPWYATFRL